MDLHGPGNRPIQHIAFPAAMWWGSLPLERSLRMSGDQSTLRGERSAQLPPRADAELSVRVAQLVFDRAHAQEERLGDLAVGAPVGGHARDAQLARRERLDARDRPAARARAARLELVVRALGQRGRAAAVREVEAPAQRVAGGGALARAPQRGAEVDERPGPLERGGGAPEGGGSAVQARDGLLAPRREPGAPPRPA